MGMTVAFGFLKNILLARELTKADFGLFNLIMTLAGFIYPVALLGQQNTVVRVFSKLGPEEYDWRNFFGKVLGIGFSIALVLTTISSLSYKFDLGNYVFLTVVICSSIVIDLYTYLFRAKGNYKTSILLHRCVRIAFPLALLALFYWDKRGLNQILWVFGALYIVHSLSVVFYTTRHVNGGLKKVTRLEHKEGFLILLADVAMLVVVSTDKLLLAKLVDLDKVGEYFAIFAITRIFELALHSIDFVLFPHSNKMQQLNVAKLIFAAVAVGGVISGLYIAFGQAIIHYVYAGKYDASYYLIPFFCGIGVLQLLHVVPASIIRGRLGKSALKSITVYDSVVMFLGIGATFFLISRWQILGAVVATSLIWFLRVFSAYVVMVQYSETRHSYGHLK